MAQIRVPLKTLFGRTINKFVETGRLGESKCVIVSVIVLPRDSALTENRHFLSWNPWLFNLILLCFSKACLFRNGKEKMVIGMLLDLAFLIPRISSYIKGPNASFN